MLRTNADESFSLLGDNVLIAQASISNKAELLELSSMSLRNEEWRMENKK